MPSSHSRQQTLSRAIRACLTGDVSLCEQVFTADVVCTSPTMAASSRDELETLLSGRTDSLSDIELTLDRVLDDETTAAAEWHVTATHVQPFLISDDTGLDAPPAELVLVGATVADFTGVRISAIRHYFDKAALVAQLGPSDP